MRGEAMPEYRVLIFQGSRLHRSKLIEASDVIEAVQAASCSSDECVEIWLGTRRMATFGVPRGRKLSD